MSDLLEAYGLKGNKFFNYSLNTVSVEGPDESEASRANRTDAQSYGIYPIQIQKVEADEIKLVSVFMGMAFIQGDIIETIPVLEGTDNREATITSTIQKMSDKTGALLSLENDIGVKLYLSSSLVAASPGLGGYADSVAGEVKELNHNYYGRLEFRRIDPDNPAAGDRAPEEYNLSSINLRGGGQENSTNRRVYANMVIENGQSYRRINLLKRNIFGGYEIEDPAVLAAVLPGVVDTLVGMNPKIGYLTDKGAPDLYGNDNPQDPNVPGLNNLRNLLGENYTLEPVSLSDGLPEDILTLLVVSPRERFSEWELFQLDQYLMKGNSLAFFVDSMDEIRPQGQNQFFQPPTYLPRNTGLEPLLAHYGFTVERSYILDENCFRRTARDQSGGVSETPFYFAPLIGEETINEDSVIMGNIKSLILLNSSPVRVDAEAPAGITPAVLFSSSPKSWEMREDINLYNPTMIAPPPEGDRLSQDAAALAMGTLTSYFKDRPIPEPPEPEEDLPQEEAPEEEATFTADQVSTQAALIESGDGKVFVLGSSTLLMDNILDEGGSSSNAAFLLNLMDTLSGREDYARMRSKGQTHRPLKETSATLKRFVKGFNIVGLPILAALFGIIVWLRGLGRKRRIELLFSRETEK